MMEVEVEVKNEEGHALVVDLMWVEVRIEDGKVDLPGDYNNQMVVVVVDVLDHMEQVVEGVDLLCNASGLVT